jgi:hypothetical protein
LSINEPTRFRCGGDRNETTSAYKKLTEDGRSKMKELFEIIRENWLRMAAHVAILLGMYLIAMMVLTIVQSG